MTALTKKSHTKASASGTSQNCLKTYHVILQVGLFHGLLTLNINCLNTSLLLSFGRTKLFINIASIGRLKVKIICRKTALRF